MIDYAIDSHCHLDLIEKSGISIDEILRNCKENNVNILQTICTSISEIDKILHYTKKYDQVYGSIGIHPCNVSEDEFASADQIIQICELNKKIIGIGETGLDYFHSKDKVNLQQESFACHIQASQKTNLPLIIHSRDADEEMASILIREQKNSSFPALLHCFSSSYSLAKTALDLNIFISISGIVTFKNAQNLQSIVRKIPLEFLLIETDSPYLAPTPYRGKVNQPSYTIYVAEFIAKLKGLKVEEIINQTSENFFKLFKRTVRI